MTVVDPADLPLRLTDPYSVIENVVIDGSGTSAQFAIYVGADHCVVRNVHVMNMPRIGIGARGISNALIERAHVEQCGQQGIWVEKDCDGVTIRDCRVVNAGFDNIQIAGTNGSVHNCRSENAGYGVPDYNGVPSYAGIYVATGSRRMVIADNYCTGNQCGIDVSWGFQGDGISNGGPDISEGVIIRNNRCSLNNGSGIGCGSNGALISGNICMDNGGKTGDRPSCGMGIANASGIHVVNNVSGNSDGLSNQQVGFLLTTIGGSGNASKNCLFIGNDFRNNPGGALRGYFARRLYTVNLATQGHIVANNLGL